MGVCLYVCMYCMYTCVCVVRRLCQCLLWFVWGNSLTLSLAVRRVTGEGIQWCDMPSGTEDLSFPEPTGLKQFLSMPSVCWCRVAGFKKVYQMDWVSTGISKINTVYVKWSSNALLINSTSLMNWLNFRLLGQRAASCVTYYYFTRMLRMFSQTCLDSAGDLNYLFNY